MHTFKRVENYNLNILGYFGHQSQYTWLFWSSISIYLVIWSSISIYLVILVINLNILGYFGHIFCFN